MPNCAYASLATPKLCLDVPASQQPGPEPIAENISSWVALNSANRACFDANHKHRPLIKSGMIFDSVWDWSLGSDTQFARLACCLHSTPACSDTRIPLPYIYPAQVGPLVRFESFRSLLDPCGPTRVPGDNRTTSLPCLVLLKVSASPQSLISILLLWPTAAR